MFASIMFLMNFSNKNDRWLLDD